MKYEVYFPFVTAKSKNINFSVKIFFPLILFFFFFLKKKKKKKKKKKLDSPTGRYFGSTCPRKRKQRIKPNPNSKDI